MARDLALAGNISTGLPVQVAAACNLGERRGRVNVFSVKNSVNPCGCCLFSQIVEKIAFCANGGGEKSRGGLPFVTGAFGLDCRRKLDVVTG